MRLLRPSAALGRLVPSTRISTSTRPLSFSSRLYGAQGYGDGNGDPRGENPQAQGSSNDTKHNAEHPGPPPPSEGHNTGGATKSSSGGKSPEDASAESGGARSKEAKETGSSPTSGKVGGSGKRAYSTSASSKDGGSGMTDAGEKKGAQPKISDKTTPGVEAHDKEKQAEVEQHNKEFEQRYDRAATAQPDKVDKKFWEGQGGVKGEKSSAVP